jgi:hypothetical protein
MSLTAYLAILLEASRFWTISPREKEETTVTGWPSK